MMRLRGISLANSADWKTQVNQLRRAFYLVSLSGEQYAQNDKPVALAAFSWNETNRLDLIFDPALSAEIFRPLAALPVF